MRLFQTTCWLTFMFLTACTATPDAGPANDAVVGGDSAVGVGDGRLADAAIVRWPTWTLEDIQPASPRAGQTYGVDSFAGKVVVVSLLEGF